VRTTGASDLGSRWSWWAYFVKEKFAVAVFLLTALGPARGLKDQEPDHSPSVQLRGPCPLSFATSPNARDPKALFPEVEPSVMAVTTSCVAGHSGTLAPTPYCASCCATGPQRFKKGEI
jgi:hypothetical protein